MPTFSPLVKKQGMNVGENEPSQLSFLVAWGGLVDKVPEMPKGCSVALVALADGQIAVNESVVLKGGYRRLEERVPNPVHANQTKISFYIKELEEDV